jgi:hypothetical protein
LAVANDDSVTATAAVALRPPLSVDAQEASDAGDAAGGEHGSEGCRIRSRAARRHLAEAVQASLERVRPSLAMTTSLPATAGGRTGRRTAVWATRRSSRDGTWRCLAAWAAQAAAIVLAAAGDAALLQQAETTLAR